MNNWPKGLNNWPMGYKGGKKWTTRKSIHWQYITRSEGGLSLFWLLLLLFAMILANCSQVVAVVVVASKSLYIGK